MIVESRSLSVSINRNPDDVYAFVSNPENLPQWAPAFCKSVRRAGAEWIIETPDGPVKIRFATLNEFRVADHYVSPAPGVEFYVPLRVLANGPDGSEVVLTLFRQPEMSEEVFRRDLEMVNRDLASLKSSLEKKVSMRS